MVQCHPGYAYNEEAGTCVCRLDEMFEFNRCDNTNRYFYVLVSMGGPCIHLEVFTAAAGLLCYIRGEYL